MKFEVIERALCEKRYIVDANTGVAAKEAVLGGIAGLPFESVPLTADIVAVELTDRQYEKHRGNPKNAG